MSIENEVQESSEELEAVESAEQESVEASESPQEAIQEALENGASKEEIKSMIREFDLKVNGKTFKRKIDLSNNDELQRELQLSLAGQMAMQKSRELEKSSSELMNKLKSDPWAILQEMGIDPDELAENRLRSTVEQLKKSPDQLEKEKIEKEIQEARANAKKYEDELKNIKQQQIVNEEVQKLESEIESALSSHTSLPKTQKTVVKLVDALMLHWDKGYTDYTVKDVIPWVEQEIERENIEFFSKLPSKDLERFIGKETMEKMRNDRVKNAKKINNLSDVKPTSKILQEDKEAAKKKISSREFFKNLK